jgi:hypothetical protein
MLSEILTLITTQTKVTQLQPSFILIKIKTVTPIILHKIHQLY